jgi:hypothetical protein
VAQVKGVLFVDYVRMLRSNKKVDWARYLAPQDFAFLQQRIAPDEWYPMTTFERMGNAILTEIAEGDMGLVKLWGRMQIDWLCELYPNLVEPSDPIESLMRFKVLRQSFFDYPALTIREVTDGEALVVIGYGMGPRAEEAAAHQTMGFFERLLEKAGATGVKVRFDSMSWEGAPETLLVVRWRTSQTA